MVVESIRQVFVNKRRSFWLGKADYISNRFCKNTIVVGKAYGKTLSTEATLSLPLEKCMTPRQISCYMVPTFP